MIGKLNQALTVEFAFIAGFIGLAFRSHAREESGHFRHRSRIADDDVFFVRDLINNGGHQAFDWMRGATQATSSKFSQLRAPAAITENLEGDRGERSGILEDVQIRGSIGKLGWPPYGHQTGSSGEPSLP
jgi:hypothetical protein